MTAGTHHAATPDHVAIIMDGNGRWASARGLDRSAGHEQGVVAAAKAYRHCHRMGVSHLTLYAFSHANWNRPEDEVHMLMSLCARFASENVTQWQELGIRLEVIGDLDELPSTTRHAIENAVEATRSGQNMILTLALSYGGRNDLIHAVRAIAAHAHAGLLLPEEINERSLRGFMSTHSLPDPDLVIRSGGEKRLSDFLLFECSMAELFFSDSMWPDFDEKLLDAAFQAYGQRQRRFGHTPEQSARPVAS